MRHLHKIPAFAGMTFGWVPSCAAVRRIGMTGSDLSDYRPGFVDDDVTDDTHVLNAECQWYA
jgi:hypothetical protein